MLLRNNWDQHCLVFDLETEDANLATTRPWQIAWRTYKGSKLIDSQNHYILWDDLQMSAGAARITGFNKFEYDCEAQENESILEAFLKLFLDQKYLIVGHNILGFDVQVLKNWAKVFDKDIGYDFLNRCVDTFCVEKAIHTATDINLENLFQEQIKLCFQRFRSVKMKLGDLGHKYEIDFSEDNLHDASADIDLNFKIFRKQLWKLNL